MMAHGMITDDDYYRALARQLGVPFMDGEVELSSLSGFPHSIMTGVAGLRVDGSGSIPWLYAPRGAQIDHWLAVRRGAIPLRNFAITTPRRLAALVTRHCGAEAADRASEGLMRQNGEAASARSWTPRRLAPGLCGLVCLYGALWLAGGVFALALSSIVALALVAFIGLRLMALAASCDAEPFPQREALRPPDLPLYTVIVALYREAGVVAQLTAALDALDYPRSRLDIKLVVEDTDTATRTALENRALPACYEIVVAPEGQPRTKPRALNIALDRARGKLVCVFDAEDIPERGQLREAAERFAALPSYVACLQGRLAIDNGADSWIAKCFALEYAALFDVINPGLAALDVPIPLGGTSNHFRIEALREAGGWDAWNVTEDIDLGFRLARFGYTTAMLASSTFEEAPVALLPWLRQRRRWFKGWLQTALVHFANPARAVRTMGVHDALAAATLVSGTLAGALLGPLFALLFLAELLLGWDIPPGAVGAASSVLWCYVMVTGLLSAFWPVWLGCRRRRLPFGFAICAMPAYWTLMTIAAWWAVADLLRNPFNWLKTDHGTATRRNAPPSGSPSGSPSAPSSAPSSAPT